VSSWFRNCVTHSRESSAFRRATVFTGPKPAR
jgi:hypothetical protein